MCFPRELDASLITTFAERLEAGGADELWVIEDCFYTTAVTLAAAALARTSRLTVGIGIMPAVARNPAITAMEIATLARLAPGRLIAGIGHGVQEWMAQMGVRPTSPVTTLEETIVAVRRLLAGEEVTFAGRSVQLDRVRLHAPPSPCPPVLAGVRGPRSLAAAGRAANGIVLAELSGPSAVRVALAAAGSPPGFEVAVFTVAHVDADRHRARAAVAPFIVELVGEPSPGLRAAPFFDDLAARVDRAGADGVATMPDEWWTELAAVGTPDDVRAHLDALAAAGVGHVGLFPSPDTPVALAQLDAVVASVLSS
jgi:alkanesulfonate monooxygenase SsuD/methylene tetrahydromethanopterin reductase-like flavin-dependent oxidoreductase (luciferase family)